MQSDLPRSGKRTSEKTIKEIFSLYSQGIGRTKIAKILGVGKRTVYRYLKPGQAKKDYDRRSIKKLRTIVNGVEVVYEVNKRPRPETCELCTVEAPWDKKRLYWHHWDDSNLDLGMWLCMRCHLFAGRVESGMYTKYQDLKGRLYELEGTLVSSKKPKLLHVRLIHKESS